MEVLLPFLQELNHLFNLSVETVYGLGANALNREAVCDIFKAKDRPFNDTNWQMYLMVRSGDCSCIVFGGGR